MKKSFVRNIRRFAMFLGFVFLWSTVSASFAYAIDLTAPTVGTITPTSATVGVATTFSVTYSDNVGVTKCTLYNSLTVLGTMMLSGTTTGIATYSYAPTSTTSLSLRARCNDAQPNYTYGSPATVSVTADTTAPTVDLVSPTSATVGVSTTFSVTYSDNAGVESCTLYSGSTILGTMTLSGTTTGTATYHYKPTSTTSLSLKARCGDATPNYTTGTAVTVTVSSAADTAAPTVGLVSPASASPNTLTTFSVSYSDNVAVTSCSLISSTTTLGPMTLNEATGIATYSYTPTSTTSLSLKARCRDLADNYTTGTPVTVTMIDTTDPTVGAVTPIAATVDSPTIFSASVSDNVGVSTCLFYIGTQQEGTMAKVAGVASYTYTPPSAGTLDIGVVCFDAAGNNGENGASVTVSAAASTDTVDPTVEAVTPITATVGTSTTFSATYSDTVGVTSCTLYNGNGVLGTGTMSLDGETSGTASFDYMPTSTTSLSLRARCYDLAGNYAFSTTVTVTVYAASTVTDSTPPTVGSVDPLVATVGTAVTLSVGAVDDVGLLGCSLYVGGDYQGAMTMSTTNSTWYRSHTFASSGTYSVYATCTDTATVGNIGTGDSVLVVVSAAASSDTTAPTVGSVSPLTATIGVAKTFSATYADFVGVESCDLYVSGTKVGAMTLGALKTAGTATYSYTPTASGSVSIQAKCKDAAPNEGSGTPKTLVVSGDTVAPTVGLITPTTATAGTAVKFYSTVSDNVAVTGCTLYVGGVSQGAMDISDGVASKSYTFSMSGSSSAKAVCVDAIPNTGNGTAVTITIASASATDTMAPTVGSVTPLTATVGTAVTFAVTASDSVGVSSCALYVGGVVQEGAMTTVSGSATKSYTPSATGTLSVYATCKDAVGNTGTGATSSVVVSAASSADTTKPEVGTLAPAFAVAGVAVPLVTAYSDAVGVLSCVAYVSGVANAMALSSGTATVSSTFSTAGSYSVYAECKDAAGNTGTSATTTVVVAAASTDETVPTIGAISPITATQNTAVTFTSVVTDASGIQECRLYVNDSDQGAMTASSSTYSKSYTSATSGTLTAYASCGDMVGNLGTGTPVTVTVTAAAAAATDTVAPTVGAIATTQAVAGVAITLSASVADSGGMGTCVVYVNSTNVGSMTVSGGYASYLYTFSAAGSAVANAYCTDAAGNSTRGASSSITISSSSASTTTTTTTTEEETSAVGEAEHNTLIKLACSPTADATDPCRAVYYYDGKRHAFPNEKVYFTWYEDFDDVIVVTDDFMSSATLGKNITYHPGTRMVKFITVHTVYAVGESGELRAVASEDVAISIWGSNWNTQIDDISDAFFGNYAFGESVDSTSDFDPDAVEASVTNIAEMFAE